MTHRNTDGSSQPSGAIYIQMFRHAALATGSQGVESISPFCPVNLGHLTPHRGGAKGLVCEPVAGLSSFSRSAYSGQRHAA